VRKNIGSVLRISGPRLESYTRKGGDIGCADVTLRLKGNGAVLLVSGKPPGKALRAFLGDGRWTSAIKKIPRVAA